jgi:hypothetical protein
MTQSATTAAATNTLFQAALFELPSAGLWDVNVEAAGCVVRFTMEAGEPLPELPTLAGWIGWPALAVLLFAIHRALVRWKHERLR